MAEIHLKLGAGACLCFNMLSISAQFMVSCLFLHHSGVMGSFYFNRAESLVGILLLFILFSHRNPLQSGVLVHKVPGSFTFFSYP